MNRIDTSTAVAVMPAMTDQGTPGFFTAGNAAAGDPATVVSADWFNAVQEELLAVITKWGGLTPDKATLTQLYTAIQTMITGGAQLASTPFVPVAATTVLAVPAGYSRMEIKAVGAGGGGMGCQAASASTDTFSGGGGAAGSFVWGIYPVTSGGTVAITVGAGGPGGVGAASGTAGGNTTIVSGDTTLVSIPGAPGGLRADATNCAGGIGVAPSGASGTIIAAAGNDGSDGQAGSYMMTGNGGAGPWGGAGRARSESGAPGSAPGAGGGGAYDVGLKNTAFTGGAGYQALVLYRFLP